MFLLPIVRRLAWKSHETTEELKALEQQPEDMLVISDFDKRKRHSKERKNKDD
jgi:hypothetical protein